VHAQDRLTAAHVGAVDHDLTIEAARPQQRGVEHVGAVVAAIRMTPVF